MSELLNNKCNHCGQTGVPWRDAIEGWYCDERRLEIVAESQSRLSDAYHSRPDVPNDEAAAMFHQTEDSAATKQWNQRHR